MMSCMLATGCHKMGDVFIGGWLVNFTAGIGGRLGKRWGK